MFHGGMYGGLLAGPGELAMIWILDLPSQTWSEYTSNKDHERREHTATIGLNNNVIIGGRYGLFTDSSEYNITFHVMLEAKSLQQLVMQTIYRYQTVIQWRCLPKKFIVLLGIETKDNRKSTSARPRKHDRKIKRLQH